MLKLVFILTNDSPFVLHKSQLSISNMPFVYRLCSADVLSTTQLHQALHRLIIKHQSLRTSLIFDTETNKLIQRIIESNDSSNSPLFTFIESIYETDEQLNSIIHDEQTNSHHFDLNLGLVFRCHLVYYKHISSNHLLSHQDRIIFNFHHAFFDLSSIDIFLHDLNQAYTTHQLPTDDNNTQLRYLDCKYHHHSFSFHPYHMFSFNYLDAVIEQHMPMTAATMYWLENLHDCKLDQSLPLPFDRYRLSNELNTGRRTSVAFDFGEDLSQAFLSYSSFYDTKLEHLALACYYVFLFKLTNGEKDLCVGMKTQNRYKDELKSMIGLFENVIPLRCQLDSHWLFHQLVIHTDEIMTNSLEYSYCPLQRILTQHPNSSKAAFLDTFFECHSHENECSQHETMIGDAHLYSTYCSNQINKTDVTDKCDFSLIIRHHANINQLSCTINASLDLFDEETTHKITQRYHLMLEQLFLSTDDWIKKPIYELSLILTSERLLIQSLNNTQVLFPSATCIHHEFVNQAMKYSQKLAVELDEQSLTYCELLYYVQRLSLHLLTKYRVNPGEIICQCVERSLSMVSRSKRKLVS